MITDKELLRSDIIKSICHDHGVKWSEVTSRIRTDQLVRARIDCCERLRMAGFGRARIGKILNRDRSTIAHYVARTSRLTFDRMRRLPQTLIMLPKEARNVILEIAECEHVTPQTVLLEWLTERAQFEIEAKRRAA